MWRHLRAGLLVTLIILSLLITALWIASYRYAFFLAGTSGRTHHQLIAVNGDFYWWRNFNWHRAEDWGIVLTQETPLPSPPIVEWPGIELERHAKYHIFETASGMWIGPWTGLGYSSYTQFQIIGTPLWCALLLIAAFPAIRSILWIKSTRSQTRLGNEKESRNLSESNQT